MWDKWLEIKFSTTYFRAMILKVGGGVSAKLLPRVAERQI